MATFNGVNNTKRTVTVPSVKLEPSQNYGRLRILHDEYTATQTVYAANDIIGLMAIPKGARVLDAELNCPDQGTTGTVDIGWAASVETSGGSAVEAASAAGLYSAIALTGATGADRLKMVKGAVGFRKKFAAEVEVQIKFTTATDAATGLYSLDVLIAVD